MERSVEIKPHTRGAQLLYIATFLPLRSWRHVIPFLRMSMRVARQMERSPGAVRYGLRTDLFRLRFWTLSAWSSRDAMLEFVQAEPHATVVRRFSEWAGDSAAFVEWETPESPQGWPEALERLKNPTFYYRK